MKNLYVITLLLAFLVFFGSCKEAVKDEKVLTKEVVFTKEGELQLKKAVTDSVIATIEIEIADDDYKTQTGLMYRKNMMNNRGMLFVFNALQTRSFYMKNTEFALDIIYIDDTKRVVSIQKNAKPLDPTSLPSEGACQYVLEVNAGLSDTWGLEKGDHISWTRISE